MAYFRNYKANVQAQAEAYAAHADEETAANAAVRGGARPTEAKFKSSWIQKSNSVGRLRMDYVKIVCFSI